jgi:DNA-binding response OmpR family regulator
MKREHPSIADWQESADELFEKYRYEKNVYRRTRLQALWQLRQGKSPGEVSELVGVSYRTLQRWIRWYREGGLDEVLRRIPGRTLLPGGQSRLTAEQLAEAKEQLDAGTFRTAQEAREWIEARWGVTYTTKGTYSVLRRLRASETTASPDGNGTTDTHQPQAASDPASDLVLMDEQYSVRIDDRVVDLPCIEYRLLRHLADAAGQLVSHEELLAWVWGRGSTDTDLALLRTHIYNLRRKIEGNPAQPVYIKTRHGLGYTLKSADNGARQD